MFTQESSEGKFMKTQTILKENIRFPKDRCGSTDSGEDGTSDFLEPEAPNFGGGSLFSPRTLRVDSSGDITVDSNLSHSFIRPAANNYLQAADSFFKILDDVNTLRAENVTLKKKLAE